MIVSNIKALMKERKIGTRHILETTGISSLTLTRARGELIRECRLSTLEAIAGALGCAIKDLFDEVEGEPGQEEEPEPAQAPEAPPGFPAAAFAPYLSSTQMEGLRREYEERWAFPFRVQAFRP